ncbi:D-2-hydroxyacid dehydrogenase family protein [Pseudooceanicola sediminis]|mgnify:CR=1 FL=1|uniref:D-2-hydroxyacid dehydrogenase family protein n=1 Tax=Pseudooceanicola sediminis TaxID=2211117 RepID=A0A399J7S5_9RHOB|nr:D-2-hydroxyacid dehydrogenase family protein [Pseudooceanicola sediminis]KAA2315515.1 D-2-hydroxyacid dehydrogenase family protein [Puniceibacterium sp. HSS470]RII40279.1 D-2-hydroxyacid dehydrogenase family protein [Pseudooceanicola sediminis]
MKIHILDDWFDTLRQLPCFQLLEGHEVTVWTDHTEDLDTLADRLKDAEALVLFRERTHVTAPLLERLPNLRLISQRGVYPHVDVEACTANGVMLCSRASGDAPPNAAAELTFALLLAAARQLPQQMQSLRAGHWQMGVGQTVSGRRLGLYGYGRIGRQVAQYADAFGMKVWWWGSDAGRARAEADGAEVAPSRASFFAESDFVSLHVRLTASTRGLVTATDLMRMKSSASFINTSRAGLVEEDALEQALAAGHPGTVALDVFDREPLTDPSDPVISHPNVICTPHIGYVTEDELDLQFTDIYQQIRAFAAGAPIHVINPTEG